MALIGWQNERDNWVVAGWAFRQVLEDSPLVSYMTGKRYL
jgi:hypothetical protein